ncbi:esterase/lipase family protein [Thiothrix caldifontis]|uniref:esterase/lipase family protein n=1 Tax=Thiothrix caldifontis TaxID=525918 RepID=UPI001587A8A0|nr:hypothetical protein [Thiothrix caldifontis]
MNGVFPVVAEDTTAPQKKVLDVVFIHGLGGDAYTTWQADDDPKKFWPAWLAEDIKNVGVWTVGYGASPTRWVEDEMPMQDRSFNLLHHFSVNKIGEKPFILVTHSMGGLIAKYLLTSAEQENSKKYRKIADNCTDIIFLAVPHNGSELANIFEYARFFVRRNEIVRQLQKDESALRYLANGFKNYVQRKKIQCISYYETKQVRVKKQGLLGLGKIVPFGKMIVSESSAIGNFSQELPVPLDADHISICKINSREDLLYLGMKEIISRRMMNNGLDDGLVDDFDAVITARINELENDTQHIINKMQRVSSERDQLKSECISDYRDVADWLSDNRNVLAERISTKAITNYKSQLNVQKIPKTEEEIEDFQLDVSQFIGQLEVCLLQDSKKIMDEPYFSIGFDVELYETALSYLLERTPDDVSPQSKVRLKYFIDYLIKRI